MGERQHGGQRVHGDDRPAPSGARTRVRALAGAAGLVGLVVVLVGAVPAAPAQAHHRSGHGPSTGAPAAKTPSTMRAWGTMHVDPYRNTVYGFVLSGDRGDQRFGLNRDDSGVRLTGLTVTVTATTATGSEQRVVALDPDGAFRVDVGSATQPVLFTASTDGDDTHHGSQTSGYFHPSWSRWPAVPPLPICLNWDC